MVRKITWDSLFKTYPPTPPYEGRGIITEEGGYEHPLNTHNVHPLQGSCLAPALKKGSTAVHASLRRPPCVASSTTMRRFVDHHASLRRPPCVAPTTTMRRFVDYHALLRRSPCVTSLASMRHFVDYHTSPPRPPCVASPTSLGEAESCLTPD